MAVTAAQVKELRERTGAGMMECKKALEATAGDMARAIEELRKSGRAKADKKASRVAAEGVVLLKTTSDGRHAIMVEINSETDFVARDENFLAFADAVAKTALQANVKDVAALGGLPLLDHANTTIDEARQALIAKVGENIHIRRVANLQSTIATIGTYSHGGRIGVLVELDSDHPALAKDIAMHIAASQPLVVAQDDVPVDVIAKEKEIYRAQAETSGKPEAILEKMVAGKIKKFMDEISLLGQPFVKDPDTLVSALLNKHHVKVVRFVRFAVGEGIEKETENFVEAVMAQVHGS
ncbi:MAG: hypothetical protein ACD_60C00060G0018 [uncultured bacterium]|nr:MAG: hypothetical protein ACD_60C00060G0018 [uncultured bacterium]